MFPNPFSGNTLLSFELRQAGTVQLIIYDSGGRRIKVLVDSRLATGRHTFSWNGTDSEGKPVANGVYYCVLRQGQAISFKNMIKQ